MSEEPRADIMAGDSASQGMLPAGSTLNGTYVIIRRMFEGGMGDIYEARHVRLTGRYAVKVLRSSLNAQHASAFERFQREAEVTSSLRHPHIVQVVDYNLAPGGGAYFVMELLEGQNLRQYLDEFGAMAVEDVAVIVEQVASALEAAHERGVVHRDLKPENIHLVPVSGRREPFVKVLDFGISKVLTATTLTQEAMLVGTPHYMAPEQARGGSDDLDGRADQFALGVIAHELLTGRRPFDATNVASIIYQVLQEDPPSLAPIAGPDFDAAIQRALTKNRDHRFPTVSEFGDAVHEAVFGPSHHPHPSPANTLKLGSGGVRTPALPRELSGPSMSMSTPSLPAASSSRRWLLVLGGAALAAAAFGGAMVYQRQQPTWAAAEGDAAAVATQLETTLRRVLDEETTRFGELTSRAARVPSLANALGGKVDEVTFQDLLANEIWWSDFRGYGCAVLVGDTVRVAWQVPVQKPTLPALARAVRGASTDQAPHAALVPDPVVGHVLAGVATIEGMPNARLVLMRPVDRALVTDLAARANTVLALSDGKVLLGVSVPEATIPEIALLAGKESARLLVDKRHGRIAAAVPWSRALWLWGVTGWTS